MGTEIRGTIHGPEGGMDARLVSAELIAAVDLIGKVEDVQVGASRHSPGRSRWAFTHLALGSVTLAIAPLEPLNGADYRDLDRTAHAVIDGLAEVERTDVVPAGWSVEATRQAGRLASRLGPTSETGMTWQLFVDGTAVREIQITKQLSLHARQAVKVRQTTIGSAIGTLGSIGVIGRRTAGLWLSRTNQRVPLAFGQDQLGMIKDALDETVQVSGRLQRNSEGQLLGMVVKSIARVPTQAARISHLEGIDPGFTGELSTIEYLDKIRGAS